MPDARPQPPKPKNMTASITSMAAKFLMLATWLVFERTIAPKISRIFQ
jgi:hypothetical protein